jgi:hypothetical protein
MTKSPIAFTFRNDAEGYVEILEMQEGVWMLWDARFPTQAEADAAIAKSLRRRECRKVWGLAA